MIESGRINIKNSCKGYYLRWWYNGWHYWFFLPGTIAFNTEGEKYVTLGTQSIRVGSGQVDYGQISALRTILNSKEVYIYTDSGWANARIEQESVIVYDNKVSGYEMEFTLFTGSKSISVSGYTPVADIPLVPYIPYIGYGALYNWYAATYNTGGASIAPTGWHVPTMLEWLTLFYTIDAVNGPSVAGGPLKEIGTTHWNSPNTDATDDYSFTALPGGYRESIFGDFIEKSNIGMFWVNETDPFNDVAISMHYDSIDIKYWILEYNNGVAIRCLMDGVDPADPGTVTDIDGNVYTTVKIGTQVWMSENLKVRHYRDGTTIPVLTDPVLWGADTTGAMCYYNNMP